MVVVMVTMEELLILSSADEVSVIGVLGRGTVMVLVMVTMEELLFSVLIFSSADVRCRS